ncbi:MAG TPA: hypothetical protein VG711_05985 [Phycisphaerales bacterium]|nr:hypothetical protein [Phycisphaerales bacterium]
MQRQRGWMWPLLAALIAGSMASGAVSAGKDPMAVLNKSDSGFRAQKEAMEELDKNPDDPEYIKLLQSLIMKWGYTQDIRIEAVNRLESRDLEGFKRTLRQDIPRLEVYTWLQWLCQHIAEKGWVELSPALVSSWARPMADMKDELKRPEYLALAKMHGEDHVVDIVFDLFKDSTKASDAGLRMRCWDLLHRLGQRDRLIALLNNSQVGADDALLIDLRACAHDLGILPMRREEVLWIRKLREPKRELFWKRASEAVRALTDERRESIELRDLGIVVSAYAHEPDLLQKTKEELYDQLSSEISDQKHYMTASDTGGGGVGGRQRLSDVRNTVKWDDLSAMIIARRALDVPEVVDHLFDYADRDQKDQSTEYGGIIDLDEKGRFEVLEFPPKLRDNDRKFNPTQEMLDAGYTAAFHFHFHAQRPRNEEYAGPGLGDLTMAENLRMNCLVMTFVNKDTLNVDYYRYAGLVVDLGVITRPEKK